MKLVVAPTFREKQKTLFSRIKQLKENATEAELIFKGKLDALGIYYIFQKGFIEGDNYCIVDFYLPRPHRLCIEIDGGYHEEKSQKIRDMSRNRYLTWHRKFHVLHLTNEEALSITVLELRELLLRK